MGEEWVHAVEAWSTAMRAAGRAETSIGTRAGWVLRIGRRLGCGPWEVTPAQLVDELGRRGWARETRRSRWASLRGFYRWAHEAGRTPVDLGAGLPAVRPAPAQPRPAPDTAYMAALAAADARTALILRLGAECGLRRAEIACVHSRDLTADLLGWSLIVVGKGGRQRLVPLSDGLAATIRARGDGWLFPGSEHGHLSPRWVGRLATRVLPDGLTVHTLRHRAATRAYDATGDLLAVQQLLGHASPVTTQRYVAVERVRVRAAAAAAAAA